jgi:uncharacterized protein (DUF885 family)
MRWISLSLCLSLCACPSPKAPDKPTPDTARRAPDDPAAGVSDPALRDLLSRHWEWTMRESPTWATQLGDHRYDDQLGDNSQAGIKARVEALKGFLGEAQTLDAAKFSPNDKTTHALFVEMIKGGLATRVCAFEEWSVSSQNNPVSDWNYLPDMQAPKTTDEAQKLLARYQKIPKAIDTEIENLKRGAAQGRYANAESTRRALSLIEKQLAQPLDEWPLLAPLKVEHADWNPEARAAFQRDLRAAVESGIKPAFKRYSDFVTAEVLPHARPDDKGGLFGLPNGADCYAAQIRYHTTLDKSAKELHELGLSEIARINEEMRVLGEKLFKTRDLTTILSKLRGDTSLYFSSKEDIIGKAEASLAAAQAKIPAYFGTLPAASCGVRPIPDYEAPFTTTAYYRQPNPDGSKPGEYFVNVYKPESRPRFEAQVLAFHESIPGHHLQIAIAQELPALPAFRKHDGFTAFVEGWALYTERLADEMGLYTSDLDRMGMLSYDAWRASRLVVDTGLHSLGWSREKAVTFMMEHTALAELNVRNEVDRYLVWPGQALAYKSGQLEIWRLRREAEKALGAKFDIKKFHDAVLTHGAVSLTVLAEQVHAWSASVR